MTDNEYLLPSVEELETLDVKPVYHGWLFAMTSMLQLILLTEGMQFNQAFDFLTKNVTHFFDTFNEKPEMFRQSFRD